VQVLTVRPDQACVRREMCNVACRHATRGPSSLLPPRGPNQGSQRPGSADRVGAAGTALAGLTRSATSPRACRAAEQSRYDRGRTTSRQCHPPLPRRCAGRGSRRPAPAHRRDAVAGPGDGCRSVAGCAIGRAAGTPPVLGRGLRLAEGRGETERLPAVHDDRRRGRRPLHPRPLPAQGRATADHLSRVAGLGLRAGPEGRRGPQLSGPADPWSGEDWGNRGGALSGGRSGGTEDAPERRGPDHSAGGAETVQAIA
jgi:hypothetical protein